MKIFEIGVMKTGTTSLGHALRLLGYKTRGWSHETQRNWRESDKDYEVLYDVIDRYDAFHDGPWHDCDYRKLDIKYPNSKFILLDRDDSSWIRSLENHTNKKYERVRAIHKKSKSDFWDRGWESPDKFKAERIAWKHEKYDAIKSYFKDRESDLLVMEISEGWSALCPFLQMKIPDIKFPHTNITPR